MLTSMWLSGRSTREPTAITDTNMDLKSILVTSCLAHCMWGSLFPEIGGDFVEAVPTYNLVS